MNEKWTYTCKSKWRQSPFTHKIIANAIMTKPRVKMRYKNERKYKNCLLEKRFGLKKSEE